MKNIFLVLISFLLLDSIAYSSSCSNCEVTEIVSHPNREGIYIKFEGAWTFDGGNDCRSTSNSKMFFVPATKIDKSKAHSLAVAAMMGKRNIKVVAGNTTECTTNTFYESLDYMVME